MAAFGFLLSSISLAQMTDSTHRMTSKPKLRSYQEVITPAASTTRGLFTIHKIDERYLFELPVSLLQRDLLIINRITEASADMRTGKGMTGYAGDPIGNSVVQFEKAPGNRLFIRRISFSEQSRDSTRPMYASVRRNTVQPVVAVFPIAAYKPDSSALVVDMTDFIGSDNDITGFDPTDKQVMRIGQQLNDRSYTEYVHSYPENVEIRSFKTYAIAGGVRPGNYTMEVNSSIVLLPAIPMKARQAETRVGYFTNDYVDYDANDQGIKKTVLAHRWRLEPRPEDIEKYRSGQLVEPVKPIVFYIDRTTPAKWVPYLIQGVEDWNVAFEAAGFRNAITARPEPSPGEDPSFSLEDARHSAIVYKPSQVPNATGPSIADPRSGEIIESHVNWYHNVMSLVHNWYMIQCGAVDPRARQLHFDDSLMGQLIRFISSHEIGHTLGLLHNFGASSSVPVDSLRSRRWVEAHGHTPSIMDYARFNYVAQPEDQIPEAGLFPRIGDYDKWAIVWGYKWFGENKTTEQEAVILDTMTTARQKDRRNWFGSELQSTDPRSQSEDLGDDAVKAGGYGIRNLKLILPHLPEWTRQAGEGYASLDEAYQALLGQLNLYLGHALKSIGGVMETPHTVGQAGPVYAAVPAARQKESLAFLDRNLFTTPTWLYDKDIFDKTGNSFTDIILEHQRQLLTRLLDRSRLSRMIETEAEASLDKSARGSVYSVDDIFSDLDHNIFRELYMGSTVDVYRRNLQKAYVEQLTGLAYPPATIAPPAVPSGSATASKTDNGPAEGGWALPDPSNGLGGGGQQLPAALCDISSIARAWLKRQQQTIRRAEATVSDRATREHLADLDERIAQAIKNGK